MTKPHEETWTFDAKFNRVECVTPDVDAEPLCSRRLEVDHLPETGRLASAAPDMARVLLKLAARRCHDCECFTSDGHHELCSLDAALWKAGVLP